MMKFVTSDSTTDLSLRHGEQYENCSEQLLIESDTTPLAALDPAILSCGLPAIVLDAHDSMRTTVAIIRYTFTQLLAFRRSPFSHRRPAAMDDPRTVQYPIWRRTGFERQRRVSAGDEDQYLLYGGAAGGGGGSGRKPNDQRQRDNGFNPPRFRRNHEFSNRNHHVIVKSYSAGDGYGHNLRLQDTIIEEEPEWVAAGPTSRLDTIELRGFDEDLARNVTESLKSSPPSGHGKRSGAFFDDLLHYEHVHPQKQGSAKGQHDTSGGGDGESVVSTSNNGSPPPARSTPTKHVADTNNNYAGGRKGGPISDGGKAPGCSASSGINVSNFEEFMKFDSMMGDLVDGNGSRFSQYFRRVGSSSGGAGSSGNHNHHSQHHQHQPHAQQHHVRFALDRNTHHYQHPQSSNRQAGSGRLSLSAMQHPPAGMDGPQQQNPPSFDSGSSSSTSSAGSATSTAGDGKSFQRLLEMMAVQNHRMQQQQQQHYLLQLLQNSQQTEALRQVLMKKCSLDGGAGGQQRLPSQAELQLHTQTIMKQALLRKKIAEQSRLILEQEPIPAVQQLIQSICPNVQRSISVLGANSGQQQQQQQQIGRNFGADGRNGNAPGNNGSLYRSQARPSSANRRY